MRQDTSVDFTGWPFLPIHVNRQDVLNVFEDGIESVWYSDDYFGGKILDFWRIYQSGLFYKSASRARSFAPISHINTPETALFSLFLSPLQALLAVPARPPRRPSSGGIERQS